MIRHPQFLEVPWDFHPVRQMRRDAHHAWWIVPALLLAALCLIGVTLTGGIVE